MTRTWIFALALLASCGHDSLTPAQRQEVRALIAADRAEQARATEEETRRTFEEHVLAGADRAAKVYKLTTEQTQSLREMVRLNSERVLQAGVRANAAAKSGDLDALNAIYHEVDAWRLGELTARFGDDVGARMNREPFWLGSWGESLPSAAYF